MLKYGILLKQKLDIAGDISFCCINMRHFTG
jgi:hypothetical protein